MTWRQSSYDQENMAASGSFTGSFKGSGKDLTEVTASESPTASYVQAQNVDLETDFQGDGTFTGEATASRYSVSITGSLADPAYGFDGTAQSGWFMSGSNRMYFAISGSEIISFSDSHTNAERMVFNRAMIIIHSQGQASPWTISRNAGAGGGGGWKAAMADGNPAQEGDRLGFFLFSGAPYTGTLPTGLSHGGGFEGYAAETWTTESHATRVGIYTTDTGETFRSERVRISPAGHVSASGQITASAFKGDGSSLTGLTADSASFIPGGSKVGGAPGNLIFDQFDAAADNGKWWVGAGGEDFIGYAINDAQDTFTQFLVVKRTGTTIDSVEFPNGPVIVTGDVSASAFSGSGANVTGVVSASHALKADSIAGSVTSADSASYGNADFIINNDPDPAGLPGALRIGEGNILLDRNYRISWLGSTSTHSGSIYLDSNDDVVVRPANTDRFVVNVAGTDYFRVTQTEVFVQPVLKVNTADIYLDAGYAIRYSGDSDHAYLPYPGAGYALLRSAGNQIVQIDSDNNGTTNFFQVRHNSSTQTGGSRLFEVNESGVVTVDDTLEVTNFVTASAGRLTEGSEQIMAAVSWSTTTPTEAAPTGTICLITS